MDAEERLEDGLPDGGRKKLAGTYKSGWDLIPKRKSFSIPLPDLSPAGWRLVADPEQKVIQIYEGNNAVALQ